MLNQQSTQQCNIDINNKFPYFFKSLQKAFAYQKL